MKHVKDYSSFPGKIDEELDIDIDGELGENTIQEVSDIFIFVKDCGLQVSDVYSGHALSMGNQEIIIDHNEFDTVLDKKSGKWIGSFKSYSIRLKSIESEFYIVDELYDELQSAIGHFESQFNCKLSSIYLRTFDGVWFNSIKTMKRWAEGLPFSKKQSLKWVRFLDLTFRVLDQVENVQESKKNQKDLLNEIFLDIKDILQNLEEHEIDFDCQVGQYHKLYSAKSWKETKDSKLVDSINITIEDNNYNFFRFDEHILPIIKTIQSYLYTSGLDLEIDVELISVNEFYSLQEFIESGYDSEEYHEIGLIIY
jgi:hypothetical protein